nr:unnamed protein product [Callosobruchus chinensis]
MEEIKSPETELFKIICKDYPSEFVLDKNVAKDYFRQFGKLKRVTFRPKLRICTVEYANKESCINALSRAGEYNGKIFEVMQSISPDAKRKPEKSKNQATIWVDKDEIEAELEAMMGLAPKSHFAEAVSTSSDLPKVVKSPKLKRPWNPETVAKMPDKSKKKIKTLLEKPDKTRTLSSKLVPVVKTPIRTSSLSPEQVDLVNVILSQATTAEDKYKVLDARDKLIRAKLKQKCVSVKSKATLGTCQDMCPEKERLMRETRHQVALYEQMDESNLMDIRKAVKQYSRSSADQETPLPHELRPVSVLQMTMCYLMHNIVDLCDTDDVNLAEWYHFMWDRTRGIRKDITQQELCCQGAVELVEQCARFHIHCSARLVAEEPSVCDQKINTENLTKCLQTLKYMYHDLQLKGEQCPNEAEFRAYVILLNLNNANFMWELQQLRPEIQKSKEVKFALDVYSAIDKNNYVKFFKLVYSTTYLNACILMRYFVQVRIIAMKTILKCYSPRASKSSFPLDELIRILAFDDVDSAIDFLRSHGAAINQEKSHFIVEKTMFQLPEFPYILDRSLNVVESKRTQSVGRVICGKDLPPKSYEDHIPQNSFDRKGYLIYKDVLEEEDLEEAKSKLLADLAAGSFESEKAERPAMEQEYANPFTQKLESSKQEYLSSFAQKSETHETGTGKGSSIFAKKELFAASAITTSPGFQHTSSIFGNQPFVKTPAQTESIWPPAGSTWQKPTTVDEPDASAQPIFTSNNIFSKPAGSASIFSQPVAKTGSIFDKPIVNSQKPRFEAPKSLFEVPKFELPKTLFDVQKSSLKMPSSDSEIPKTLFEGPNPRFEVPKPQFQEHSSVPKKGGFSFPLPTTIPLPTTVSKPFAAKAVLPVIPSVNMKQLEEEKRRRELEELRKKEDVLKKKLELEKKLLEEQKAKEEERLLRLKKKKQEEALKRKMEEIERELEMEKQRKEFEIKTIVEEVLNTLVETVEEMQMKEKLEALKQKIKNRLASKVIKQWQNIVLRNKRKRKAMDCSPVWINTKTLKQEAEELHTSSQDLTLALKKRYKYGKSIELDPVLDDQVEKIDLYNMTQATLKKRYYDLTGRTQKNIFWKVILSVPDEEELQNGLNRIEETLENALDWKDRNDTKVVIEQHKLSPVESITYCVEKQKGLGIKEPDANGIIFIAKDYNPRLQRRIFEHLKDYGVFTRVPIVVLLQEYDKEKCNLNPLIEEKIVSDYVILVDNLSPYVLVNLIEEGLVFLASKVEKPPPLELDTLASFLDRCLCTEIWKKANSFAKWNECYKFCLMNPNLVISLYNEALSKLTKIALNKSWKEYAIFPEAFKDYLSSEIPDYLPCTYHYFPNFWKDPKYITKLEKTLKSLKLPKWDDHWPPSSELELEVGISKYCTKVYKNPEKPFYRIMSVLLKGIDPSENFKNISNTVWTDVIEVLSKEKLKSLNLTLKGTPYENKSIYNQYVVVYDAETLHNFTNSDWFYVYHPLVNKHMKRKYKEEKTSLREKSMVSTPEIDIDKTVREVQNQLRNRSNVNDMKKKLDSFSALLSDLETSMTIAKKISSKFEQELKNAIDSSVQLKTMSGQDTVLDHAIEAAKKAVQFDQQGESTIAAYYYEAAVRLLNQAATDLPPDQAESLKEKAVDYSNRAGELKNKTPEPKIEEDSAKTESKTRLKQCHFLLQQAIEEDEQGDKDEAIELYAQAVEYCTQYPDLMQGELKTLILQALDRAEELKGIKKGSSAPSPARIIHQKPTTSVTPRHRPELHRGTSVHLQVSGQDTYSEEEKKVLLHTSRINKREYVPFMSVDLSEKFQYAIPFTDKDGPLPLVEKQRKDFYKFARPEELCSDPCIVAGQFPNYLSIKQTVISDCSFVASLAVSANYEKKFGRKLVTAIIYPQTRDKKPLYNPFGKYMIKLHINGVARKVIIDDSLPIDRSGRLLCSYSSNKNEFWVSFLEKAYMKVMGGYDFPGSNSNIDLHALTGWIPERVAIRLKEPDFNKESLFNTLESRMEKGDVLVTVATGELSDYESERSGLVPTHAYAVMDVQTVKDVKLLKLKNPWSHLRWRGNYSELDAKHWTPELQRQLNYDPNSAAQSWHAGTGPVKDLYTIGSNPQYSLDIKAESSGAVWLLLTRHITEIDDFRENQEYINLFVYKVDPPPYIDGIKINSPHYLCKIILNPSSSRKYTVVVSQHEKSTTIYYTLRAYATCPFTLTKIVDPYRYEKQVGK